jgi:hypothetical protein
MATTPLVDRIEKAIDSYASKHAMFTLLDISQTVKADGGPWVSHSDMKPVIESALRDALSSNNLALYTVSNIEVQTAAGPTLARLFHPVSQDPAGYLKRSQKALAPVTAQVASFTLHMAPATPAQASPGHPSVTGRLVKGDRKQQVGGYVEIPRPIWEKAGFTPGVGVVFDMHPKSLTIYHLGANSKYASKLKKADPTLQSMATVPAAGRFRIAPTFLANCGLDGCTLDFSAYTDKIVVYPKK